MRQYDIYLMEEEIARQYFGQESKLFHLFLEQKNGRAQNVEVINKQIDFITQPISTLQLQQILTSTFRHNTYHREFQNSHYLSIKHPYSEAELTLNPNHLKLVSTGEYEAETLFFEALRKYDPYFYAIESTQFRYGWLNPIKQFKLI
ncbi:sporulation inhibitor of replication protein SirA [Bacillus alkalicellulosilyticus]|uniref:sporulation inhibitor of replication protein SirA n=1 Tax=Alkalihalobacterium alkalicellulosilyticum TaxID=1912214 RepID=UPI0009988EDE|nr:sporulation inhibitor of replication protein SirA [Bacillus alkalicellulosilyticus]